MKTFFNDHSEQEDVENEGNNQKKIIFLENFFEMEKKNWLQNKFENFAGHKIFKWGFRKGWFKS